VELPRSTPAAQGVDPRGIHEFLDAVAERGLELHSLMVLRHGEVIAEGWWAPYGPNRPHQVYSLSKSFASTAIGLAVAEGVLSLDDRVVSFFPAAVPENPSPLLLAMSVRHLLCMATGHREDTTWQVFESSGDPVRTFFRIPPDQAPGSVMAYNSPATYLLSAIITAVTGERLIDYLRPRLFEPLGINHASWTSLGSIDLGFIGLQVTTESIAKLGQLYLQHGTWQGRQLLPQSWVSAATARQISTVTPWRRSEPIDWQQGYGYQFWRCRHNAYRADGSYGQFCVVVPDADLVLATTSATNGMQAVLDATWSCLLPAVDRSPADDASCARRLESLRLPPVAGSASGPAGEWVCVTAVPTEDRRQFPPVTEVVLHRKGEGWALRFDKDAEIVCGHGVWTEGVVAAPRRVAVPVVASAAWVGPRRFAAEVILIETPYRLRITCDLDERSFGMSWNLTFPEGEGQVASLSGGWDPGGPG
jgi:CubicO group peptidase (beta-lactamase class C family)